ncbi:MAG: NapC/NirT family cytochrome c [Candidatus Methanosuratus sp.]|nr:NapC/NirT family cytochrome c [Candidatus Methanosuratincola sp.]
MNKTDSTPLGGRMRKRTVIIICVVVVLLVAFAGVFVYTATPSFCASCHEMAPRVAYWESSAHSHFDCFTCHSEPGMLGEFKAHLAGVREVFLHFTNLYTTPIHAEVDNALCLDCHQTIEERNVVGDIVMVHGRHMRNDVLCTDCHDPLVHRDPSSLVQSPAKETCITCHSQKDVSTECMTCHLEPVALRPAQ